ncbi:MAG TPA: ABC transporter substrate-binding protein, partial [Candidatus Acidoferrales bacterium]|nr:ABC transporter substrate-binding protein [Candidatus Acidoferrales bacterium]
MAYPRTGRALTAVLAASMLVATACAGNTPSASNAPSAGASASAAASEQPQQGGSIVEGTTSDIATVQPVLSNDTASARVIGLQYDSILIQDPKTGAPTERLAKFSTSADGLTYTFEMNAKANWSDGKPIIADDYLTAIKAVGKSKKTVRKSSYQDVVGFKDYSDGKATTISGITIDSSNPKKWTVKMTKVSCPAILDLNTVQPLPTQVFGKYVTDASKDEIDNAPENT